MQSEAKNFDKAQWRLTLKERLAALPIRQATLYSEAICQKIYHSAAWSYAETIALYAALPEEPQLRSLAEMGWAEKKTILFPKVDPTLRHLTLHALKDLTQLQAGTWGILEPLSSLPTYPAEAPLDLICVPGLGFDRRGVRLGRGKGFYDQLLAALPAETIKLGTFFSIQEIARVPELSHDFRLDGVVTEQELFLL